jgi:molecular chaperone DnaK (HSP70)
LYILQTAGTLAQLDILDMSPRPYAAVYAHTSYSSWEDCYVLVFDLGDYTTVSIVQVAYGKTIPLATTSPDYFSGHDLDHPVIHYLSQLHNNKTGIDVSQDSKALAKLKIAVKRARHDLSVQETTVVTIEALSHDIDLVETLSRDELEHLNAVAFNKILPLVNQMFHGVETIYDTSSITIEDVSEASSCCNEKFLILTHRRLFSQGTLRISLFFGSS